MRLFIRLLNLNERGIETVSMLLGTVLTLIGAILLMGSSSVITGMMVIALGVFLFSNGIDGDRDRTIKKEVILDPTAQDFEARKAELKSLGYAWNGDKKVWRLSFNKGKYPLGINLNECTIEMVSMLLGAVLTLVGTILLIGSSVITGMIVIALGVFLFSDGIDREIKRLDP